MIVKRTKIARCDTGGFRLPTLASCAPCVDWIEISTGEHTAVVLHPDEAVEMARIIMDLVCDIRHEQGWKSAEDAAAKAAIRRREQPVHPAVKGMAMCQASARAAKQREKS